MPFSSLDLQLKVKTQKNLITENCKSYNSSSASEKVSTQNKQLNKNIVSAMNQTVADIWHWDEMTRDVTFIFSLWPKAMKHGHAAKLNTLTYWQK